MFIIKVLGPAFTHCSIHEEGGKGKTYNMQPPLLGTKTLELQPNFIKALTPKSLVSWMFQAGFCPVCLCIFITLHS